MDVDVEYDKIKVLYAGQIDEAMAKLRAGKSRQRGVAPENMAWRFFWGEAGTAITVGELAAKLDRQSKMTVPELEAEDAAKRSKPVDVRVQETLGRLTSVEIMGVFERAMTRATLPPGTVPAEVLSTIQQRCQAAYDEDQRILGLTPEQREAEAEEAFKQLGFQPPEEEAPPDDGLCCDSRRMRAEGWDGPGGHHLPLHLQKVEGTWHLVSPEWFLVDIDFCPWCGTKLVHDPAFVLGESAEATPQDSEPVSDDVLDRLERELQGGE
jgi:hypothetical protein